MGENDLLTSVQNYTTGTEARVGTPLVYGAIHQLGGSTGRGTIPARAYLGLSEADRDEVVELVVDTLERRLP